MKPRSATIASIALVVGCASMDENKLRVSFAEEPSQAGTFRFVVHGPLDLKGDSGATTARDRTLLRLHEIAEEELARAGHCTRGVIGPDMFSTNESARMRRFFRVSCRPV